MRKVRLPRMAERDLEEIVDWIAVHDSPAHAEHVFAELVRVIESLANCAERGIRLAELPSGIDSFRQLFFKPYCVIYRVEAESVIVFVVADVRRNLQSLLLRRITEA